MKGVSKEEVAQAKQVDFLSYLKTCEPQNLKPEGPHDYRHKAFPTLVISDNGKWNWTDHEKGGTTALNYLIEVQGVGFVDAVRQINTMQGRSDFSFQPVPIMEKETAFQLPPTDENSYAVNRYLRSRCMRLSTTVATPIPPQSSTIFITLSAMRANSSLWK